MDREEAIKIVQSATVWTDEERDALAMLIPELAESEDERIRKFLIQHISEWIGCLEEDLKVSSKDIEQEKELAMFKACLAYLEKRKEQKYIGLSKADKLFLQDVADVLGDNEYKDAAKRLRDLSESLYLQPKAEWNKEDEIMLKWIEDILLIADDDLSDKLNGKVRPITDSAYSSMKLCIAKCLSWLKSFRPSWKPSEEQMEALYDACCIAFEEERCFHPSLSRLYHDLRKL